ncbi:MAG TPA: YceI family protein [Burkholderiales bacterium]
MNSARWLLSVFVLCAAAAVQAAEWRMDRAASRLEFQASYQGEPVPGAFREFETKLRFDPVRPADGRLEVLIKIPSVDFGSAEINEAVREPEWFDVKRFAEASFVSSRIEATGPGRYVAHGTLTLKGVKQSVAVPFEWRASGKSATMKGEVTLKRTAFGIGTGEWESGDLIGLDVKVLFDVALQGG